MATDVLVHTSEIFARLLLETSKQVLMQGYGDKEKLVGQMLQTLFIGELSHVTRLLFIYPRLLLGLSNRVNFQLVYDCLVYR